MFRLKRPCANCPFRKVGAIELRPGRLQGIIDKLVTDDWSHFQCHDTVHGTLGGTWSAQGRYRASGQEAMCAGAAIYLEKARQPTVGMRLGRALGFYDPNVLKEHWPDIIEPKTLPAEQEQFVRTAQGD